MASAVLRSAHSRVNALVQGKTTTLYSRVYPRSSRRGVTLLEWRSPVLTQCCWPGRRPELGQQ